MIKKLRIVPFVFFGLTAIAQDESEGLPTFQSTRIINGHSIEQLGKGVLEFRVEHRFGDIAGTNGGAQTMFGLDNSSDIRLAFEYGITDKLMVGIGRSKGARTPFTNLMDGFAKYTIFNQVAGKMPISLGVLGVTNYTYMKASDDISLVNSFPKQAHRFSYVAQVNIARRFSDRLSVAVLPTLVHRNLVRTDDVNTLFSIGTGGRIGLTDNLGLILEYYHNIHDNSLRLNNKNSFSVAFEWMTFGHNFTIYLTNSGGFGEVQYVANTEEDWLKGQFRLGFCIGRKFEREQK